MRFKKKKITYNKLFISDIYFESLYRAKYTCWLQDPSFLWGFLVPIGNLLLINLVVFVIVIKKIFQKRKVSAKIMYCSCISYSFYWQILAVCKA